MQFAFWLLKYNYSWAMNEIIRILALDIYALDLVTNCECGLLLQEQVSFSFSYLRAVRWKPNLDGLLLLSPSPDWPSSSPCLLNGCSPTTPGLYRRPGMFNWPCRERRLSWGTALRRLDDPSGHGGPSPSSLDNGRSPDEPCPNLRPGMLRLLGRERRDSWAEEGIRGRK